MVLPLVDSPTVGVSGPNVAAALEQVVADIMDPSPELALRGTVFPDWCLAVQGTAGDDPATLYRLDNTASPTFTPYIVPSAVPGYMWVAIAGRNMAQGIGSLGDIGCAGTVSGNVVQATSDVVAGGIVRALGVVKSLSNSGASIQLDRNGATGIFTGSLSPANLTANRRWTFPNADLTMSGSVGALTPGRVPFVGAGGVLTESALLTFDGADLSSQGYVTTGINAGVGASRGTLDFVPGTTLRLRAWGPDAATAGIIHLRTLSADASVDNANLLLLANGSVRAGGTIAATSPIVGTVIVGDGVTSATNVAIGGGNIVTGGNVSIRSVPYVWPAANASGALTNDGAGNLTWAASAAIGGSIAANQVAFGLGANTIQGDNKIQFTVANGLVVNLAATGVDNLTLGATAGNSLTSGGQHTLLGTNAGTALTNQANVVAVGYNALAASTQSQMTAVGANAGALITTATTVVAIGFNALSTGTTGVTGCTAVGHQALLAATGTNNSGLGVLAGSGITTGANNTCLGASTGGISTGSFNTCVGASAAVGTGLSNNTALGYSAACTGVGTAQSIAIGVDVSVGFAQCIAIGGQALPTAVSQLVLGGINTSITAGFIGKGVTSTTAAATVSLGVTGGSGANNAGSAFIIAGGRSTGNITGGAVRIQTAPAGASSSTAGTLADRLTVAGDGGVTWTGIPTASQPALAPASTGTIFYDATLQAFRYSVNGGAYADLVAGGGAAVAAFWAAISNATALTISAAGAATANRVHVVDGTAGDYDITLPVAPAAGTVVGFLVREYAAASKQFRLNAGAAVIICGRTQYLTLLHTNVALLRWDGTRWQALVLDTDTPWIDGGVMTITATTTAPIKGTAGGKDNMWWRRVGKNLECLYRYKQTAAGTAGSGAYIFAFPIGAADADQPTLNGEGESPTDERAWSYTYVGNGYVSDNATASSTVALMLKTATSFCATCINQSSNAAVASGFAAFTLAGLRFSYRLNVQMQDW